MVGGRAVTFAQTTLSAGDIAFIGYFSDGVDGTTPQYYDGFTFILLKDIAAGTIIYFTDNGWSSSGWVNSSSEMHVSWTATSSYSIGTIVYIYESSSLNNGVASIGSLSSLLYGDTWHWANHQDQIIAYQSSSVRPSSPSFIAGLDVGYNTNFDGSDGWSTGSSSLYVESYCSIPSGLSNGTNCVALLNSSKTTNFDNLKYNGTLTGEATTIRTAINTWSNWTGNDAPPFDISSSAFPTPNITAATPEINLKQSSTSIADGGSYNFGTQNVSTNTDVTFTIENTGSASLTLSGSPIVSITGTDANQFSVQSQPSSSVSASGTTTFSIRFSPTSTGAKTAEIAISNNDSDENPYNLTLQGTGAASPEINIKGNGADIGDGDTSPTTDDHTNFGSVAAASVTISRTFTIQNTGTATLTLGSSAVSVSGGQSGDFTITDQPATSIAAGGSDTFTIEFNPSAVGTRSTTVNIANDDSNENPYNFSIQGTGTNTAPTATAPSAPTVTEDATNVALNDNIQVTDADGDNQTVTFTITGGTVTLSTAGITFGGSGNGSASFTAAGTLSDINTALDAATFTPTANLNGANAGTISFTTNDGTVSSGAASVTFNITAVNDAPTATAPSAPTVSEDATNVALSDDIQVSDVDGDAQTVTFTITGGTVTLGTTGITFPSGSNGSASFSASGTLAAINTALDAATFTPTANLSGTNAGTISFTTNDGTVSSSAASVTFNITAVNDTPVLDSAKSPVLAAINEDPGVPTDGSTVNSTLVSSLIDNGGAVSNYTDADNDSPGIAVTVVNQGTLYYSINGGTNWTVLGAVAANSALILNADANTRVYFKPNANINGTVTDAIVIKAWDRTSGVNGNTGVNTTVGTAFSTATDNVGITITGVNDDPAMTGSPTDITVFEDAASNVDLSAASLTDVDAASGTVTLTMAVGAGTLTASSGGSVIVSGSGTGTLVLSGTVSNIDTYLNTASNIKYTGTSNTNGNNAATLTLTANDGGSTGAGGGTDVSLGTVNIDITAVNDEPSFTIGSNKTVAQNAGAQSVSGFITNINDGDADVSQTVSFNVSNDNTTLFSSQPAISSSGTLTFTPDATKFGKATVTVSISDDGGTANGGDNQSPNQTFKIFITPGGITINELNSYNSTDEFVELYNATGTSVSLNGLVLVFFNGGATDDATYRTSIDLDGYTLASKDFFVSGDAGVSNVDISTGFTSSSDIQDGPDAVALFVGDQSDFPNGTAATGDGLVDAIVYGSTDDAVLRATLGGVSLYDENANSSKATETLSRTPDGTGGFVAQTATPGATNDVTPPTVSSVSSTTANGTYKTGDVVAVTVTFSESVTITGTPTIALNSSGSALCASGSGTTTLTFNYTVGSGDNSADLDYSATNSLALNSGTIKDAAGNNATLTLPTVGGASSLGGQKNIVIDGIAPTVSSVSSSTENGTYKTGDIVAVTVTFSENVTITGTPTIALNSSGTASYASGSGTATLTFNYTVVAGHSSTDLDYSATNSLALNSGTIKDAAGNNATLTLPTVGGASSLGGQKNIVIDGVAPTVSSVSSSTANGTYGLGEVISITVTFSEAVTVTGTPQLELETGPVDRTVNYTSGTTTNALTFSYTTQAGDESSDLDYKATGSLALNSGTIKDAAGNNATLTLATPGAAGSLGANKAIVIQAFPTVTLSVSSSSIAENAGTSTITATLSQTSSQDVIVSLAYSGTATNGTDYNSTASTSITIPAGNTSANASVGITATQDTDAEGNQTIVIDISGVSKGTESGTQQQTITILDDDVATVTSVSSSTTNGSYNAGDAITINVSFNFAVTVTGTPQLTLETGTTDRVINYSSGTGSNTLVFTYTVQSGDTSNDLDYTATNSLFTNGGTIRNSGIDAILTLPSPGASGSLGANKSIVIDTTNPTATVVLDDSALRLGETATVTITFSEAVTGFTNADLTVPNGTLTSVSSSDGGITYTATYTPSSSVEDATNAIVLDNTGIVDAAGNSGSGTTSSANFTIDTKRPTVTVVLDDSALRLGETATVTITFSEAVTGFTNADLTISNGTLSVVSSLDGGITFTATFTPSGNTEDATNAITLDNTGVSDAAGNAGSGTTSSANFTIDTKRPTATVVLDDSALRLGETATVTITFSEAVTGFTNADLTVPNGTLTSVSSSDGGITYTATFTPSSSVEDATNAIVLDNTGIVDAAGNSGSGTTSSANFTIDTKRPTATVVLDDSVLRLGETATVTITFSEAVTGFTNADLTVPNGTLTSVSSSDGGITYTATFTPSSSVEDATNVIVLDNTGVVDAAGNAGAGTTNSDNFTIETTVPTINNVTSTKADGTYGIGEEISITVTFSEAVTVTGTPQLELETGPVDRTVNYTSGTTTNTLTFSYTTQAGDESSDLDYKATGSLALNSGTIKDAAGNNATLTLATPGAAGSIGANKAIVIQAFPTVTLSVGSSGIAEDAGTSTITATLSQTSSQAVTVSLAYSGTATNGIDYNSTASTSITIPAGSLSGNAVTGITATQDTSPEGDETIIIDISSISKGFEGGTQQQTITIIDDDAPTVSSVSVPANGTYRTGQNLDFTVTFNQAVTINTSGGIPSIPVTIGVTTVHALLSGTVSGATGATFRYTVLNNQEDTNGITLGSAIATNGATIQNAALLNAITTLNNIGSTSAVLIDAVVPTLTASLPADNASNSTLSGNIVLTFDDTMQAGSGNITIKKSSDGSIFEQVASNGSKVTFATTQVTVNPSGILEKGTAYYLEIDNAALKDDAGNPFAGISGSTTLNFTTVNVVVNEIVTDPQQDWSSTSFASVPGGSAGTNDEWIELFIQSDGIDLSGWTITVDDGVLFSGDLSNTGAFDVSNYIGTGVFGNTKSGDYLVLGNPDGSNTLNDTGLTIQLKDPGGAVVDAVTIGGGSGEAPSGNAAGIYDEAVQRFANGTDTNTDSSDFTRGMASLGAVNTGPSVTLTSSKTSVSENNQSATITVALSAPSSQSTTVNLSVSGTAISGTDYSIASSGITIPAGSSSGTAMLTSIQDAIDEEDETVIIDISSVTNGTENGTQQKTVTITDDDPVPAVAFNLTSSSGAESVGSANLQVDLSAASGLTVTIDYTVTGTASGSGTDYTLANGTLTFNAGETSKNITIASIVDDLLDENNETVIVTLSNPVNVTIGTNAVHTYTINDNDPTPTVAFNITSSNGAESVSSANLQVDLSAASGLTVTVDYTVTGTASGSGTDYTLANGTLTFNAGETSKNITIASIVDDLLDENNETVIVTLSNLVNVTIGTNTTHTYTITDNDPTPTVAFNTTSSNGTESVSSANLQVDLSAASGLTVTVDYTVTGTASGSGTDYTLANGTLTFNAGETSKNITIASIVDDLLDENNETVIVTLSNPVNATIGTNTTHTYTITDNDPTPTVAFNITSSNGTESVSSSNLQVDLSAASGLTVTVDYTITGTASGSGTDYMLANGTLTFNAGETSKNITIASIVDDLLDENNETVIVTLSNPTNATLGTNTVHTYTIDDNDEPPTVTLSVSPSNISEAPETSTITVTLSAVSSKTVIVTISANVSGTATGGGTDYTLSSTSITINAGGLTGTTTIVSVQDSEGEGDETIIIDIVSVSNGIESGEQKQTITIVDDDAPIVTGVAVPSDGIYRASQNLDFTVTFNQPVSINTSGGTPYIPVTIGSTVVNASLSGTVTNSTTALFRYTVQTGQEDTDGITVGSAVSVNGSTIRNAAGLDAITTLNSVGSTTNVKVDAIVPVAPVVTGISTDSNTAADGITSDNTLLINGTSEPNATVEVFINTVSAGTTAANGTGNWQFDHTATVLPDGNYSLTAKATDAAGNTSAASTAYTVTVDTAKPSVVITGSATNPTNSAFTATFTFNEGVYNFAIGDITVGNGLASNFSATSVTVYTATITPVTNGVVTVDVAAGVSNDLSGNTNTVATQYSITYDTVKPTVTISSPALNPANSVFTATFTFSEAVTGFTIDDITVGNGSSGSFTATSASVYTATVTPLSDGTVTVDVNADVAQDAAGNKNTVAARYSVTYDATRPGVTITGKDINHLNKSFTAEFTFSEAVTGFTAGDITLSAGTVNNFSAVSSTLYSALVKDAFASSVLVDVAAGLAIDAAGNTNTAATTLKVEFDETPPTVYCRDTVLYLNPSGNAGITAQDLDKGSHDHFGIAGMKIDKSTFTCDNLGSNTVILTVTDNSGNISTCNAIVTVVDTITVKTKDITILLDATGKAAITPDQVDDGSFSACGIVSYKLDKTEFDCSNYGINTVILTVTGRGGNTKSGTAVVTVESVNRAPVFDPVSNAEVQEDVVSFTVQITGIKNGDCEGVAQQVKSVTAAATGSIIEKTEVVYTAGQESAVLTIFLKKDVSGEATVTVTAKDNGGTANNGTDTYSSGFKVTVLPVNDAPVLAGNIDPQKAEVGKAFLYTLPSGLFTDIDEGDELTYSVTAKTGSFPGWLSFDSSTLSFSGTPGESDKGNFLLKITVTDKSGESASTYMEVIVYQTTSSVLAGYLYQKSELLNGGATVALYERIGEVPTTVFKLITRTTVSSHGSFGFYNLSPGRYIVEATIIDQEKYGNLLTTYFDKSDNWSDASAVLLENNSTRYIDMVMLEKPVQNQGSFIISGFIIQKTGNTTKSGLIEKSAGADSGEPLAGVNIQLKQDGKIIATCISDENGHYEFKGLPEGVYQIEVMVPGFSQQEVVAVEMNEQSTVEEEVNFTVWEGTNVITDLEIHRLPVEVKIYPNPTSGKLTVGIENRYTFVPEIRVYSITGQLIFEKTDIRDKSTVIDMSGQNPGIYLLRVTTGHDQQTHQVILK
ncbi:MAG: hypothetical protein A2W90_09655 [Bacteroidetes bacterium GWF2_42_66]|nr:MAG: hypothetical protein A2W89_01750 [Bacteroidetes bacterium GWE2_42_39]OFY43735.1 MAG: hypothetical protein A2W90_09655 [Bacteroidetes bacterium GWF2_42_66]